MGRTTLERKSILTVMVLFAALIIPRAASAQAQEESGAPAVLWPKPAEFVGLAKCAACHFEQYKDWKVSPHSKAFEILPLKYRNDATCIKCHTTGSPGDVATYQYGVSCQACHGPGEEHANFALRSGNQLLTEDGLKTLRGKIHRLDMRQCVNCHISKAHKKHPPYDREAVAAPSGQGQTGSFFQSVHGQKANSR